MEILKIFLKITIIIIGFRQIEFSYWLGKRKNKNNQNSHKSKKMIKYLN